MHPEVFKISAVTGEGLKKLNYAISNKVTEIKNKRLQESKNEENYDKVWKLNKKEDDEFKVTQIREGVFEIEGKKPVRAVVQTDFDNEEAVVFLQHRLKRMGVEKALSDAGAIDGDEIEIAAALLTQMTLSTFEMIFFSK